MSHLHPKTSPEWEPNGTSLYSDLQDSDEFRLLYLQPGSRGEMIKCTMKHAKFSEKPTYEALSYVWGPENVIQPIVINGYNVYVRQNMWLAMQHLRSDTEVRVLWIDATCINQQNIYERNHQVTQMGMIYHQATRVIIWLGSSDAVSKLAFELLSSPTEWSKCIKTPSAQDPVKSLERDNRLKAILSLFSRDYWSRVWIIQEVVMARDFILMCGDDKCSGFRFSWFMALLRGLDLMPLAPTQTNEAIADAINHSVPARLCQIRNMSKSESSIRQKRHFGDAGSGFAPQVLFGMFSEFKTSKCEDQRDKVFGFHSLAMACCKISIPIDYSLTWDVILGRLVHHQITSHDSLPNSVKSDPDTAVMCLREFFLKTVPFFNESQFNNASLLLRELEPFSQSFTDWSLIGNTYNALQPVELRLYARGRVCYTSPSFEHLDSSKHSAILPELTPMVALQMSYICSLNKNRKSCNPYVTTETDLIALLLPQEDFRGLPRSISHTMKFLTQNPIPYWGGNVQKHNEDGDSISSLANNFRQLLSTAQESFSGSKFILAFEENGLIFLAARETKVGDLLCQFYGSDVLVVVPADAVQSDDADDAPKFAYLGSSPDSIKAARRAVNFLASPHDVATDVCGKPMSISEAKPYGIRCQAGPEALKPLCRISKSPNGPQNILGMQI
jgi:hypothetical protein